MKKIKFIPSSKDVQDLVPCPKPSKLYIPDTYKNIKNNSFKKLEFDADSKVKNKTIKSCIPYFDSLSHGYIQQTWCDIYIEKNSNDEIVYHWASGPQIMKHRETISKNIKENFYNLEFSWMQPWKIKTPKGFSSILCHPLNREDLPFYTLSGIIDSDSYFHSPFGNIPFYIDKNFQGLIPEGTPMFQIIPIKREEWESETEIFYRNKQKILSNEILKKFISSYKENFWIKKSFT